MSLLLFFFLIAVEDDRVSVDARRGSAELREKGLHGLELAVKLVAGDDLSELLNQGVLVLDGLAEGRRDIALHVLLHLVPDLLHTSCVIHRVLRLRLVVV